ncbi:tetratricopeptide repeat protein [Sphingomonas sp. ST-64]|uniref:Tetratricopeptide repeat protein n=1 Tax=Sphingomonas plantiphila TaxID=3163295 RepID=A0ABW8YLA8_9SPHN
MLSATATLGFAMPVLGAERWRLPQEVKMIAQMGDNRTALALLLKELDACEAGAGTADRCLDLLVTAATLAQRTRDAETAEAMARRAAVLADRTLAETSPDRALAHRLLGSVLTSPDAALAEYRIALNLYSANDNPAADNVLADMLRLLDREGRYAEGEALHRRIVDTAIAKNGPDHPDVAAALTNLAINLSAQRREDAAHPLLVRALAIYEQRLPPGHPYIALLLTNVGASLVAMDRANEAVPLLERALALREKTLAPGHPDLAVSLNALASAWLKLGELKQAETLQRRALELRRASLPEGSPGIARGLINLAFTLKQQGRFAEAEPLYREARGIVAATHAPDHPMRINADWSLAEILLSGGADLAESRSYFRAAARGALARIGSYRDFDTGATRELATWRNIFAGQARIAWALR